jgi:hypothetical protein
MEYEIKIPKDKNVDPYEQNKENVACIIIKDKSGQRVSRLCKVKLCMSKSAMLEFGKELIRDTYKKNGGSIFHFYHAGTGLGINETLGVVLHPKSVEPIIIDDLSKPIDKYLEEASHDL